jgi:midasin (ATPase involved in ribosome maturation)
MTHTCTNQTDLLELIGSEGWEGQRLSFHEGPLTQAMKRGEELILENSATLSPFTLAKVTIILDAFFIDDTAELIEPQDGFRLTLR